MHFSECAVHTECAVIWRVKPLCDEAMLYGLRSMLEWSVKQPLQKPLDTMWRYV